MSEERFRNDPRTQGPNSSIKFESVEGSRHVEVSTHRRAQHCRILSIIRNNDPSLSRLCQDFLSQLTRSTAFDRVELVVDSEIRSQHQPDPRKPVVFWGAQGLTYGKCGRNQRDVLVRSVYCHVHCGVLIHISENQSSFYDQFFGLKACNESQCQRQPSSSSHHAVP